MEEISRLIESKEIKWSKATADSELDSSQAHKGRHWDTWPHFSGV